MVKKVKPWSLQIRGALQSEPVSILLYGCTTWRLTKRIENWLDRNFTIMLHAMMNKFWKQHPKKLQLYGYLPPISKTIQVRRIKHIGLCRRSKDELICDVLLRTPSYGRANVGRPTRIYLRKQLCPDRERSTEDL